MYKPTKSVLITDLDNTLFDWVALWYACFGAMFEKILENSGVPESILKEEIKAVHQKHGTSGELKPNKHILLSIIQKVGATPDQCVYVGDGLIKDVAMAKDARVRNCCSTLGYRRYMAFLFY